MINKLNNNKLLFFLFSFILLIGFLVRVWNISSNPAGFFADEASFEYNAYKILKTGKDEFGVSFPVYFKAFGEYKNPVYIYSAVPVVMIFGLSELSIRMTSLIYGLAAIIILYFLAKELFNQEIGLISAFFLAISPWHIHFSRFGFEVITTPFWVSLSILFLIKSIKNFKFYPYAIISLILSFLTYNPPKIYLLPLYISFLIIFFDKTKFWFKSLKFWIFNFLGVIILLILIWPYLINGGFFERWNQVKMTSMTFQNILTAYLNHFSPVFLFKSGEIDFPGSFITRTSIRGIGELYWFQLPLIIISLFSLIKNGRFKKSMFFIISFLIIYPISSMFTIVTPSATRSIIGVIPFQIISAAGFYYIFSYFKKGANFKKYIFALLSLIVVISSLCKFIYKLSEYPNYSADYWGWQYGPKEIITYFKTQSDKYDELYMTGSFNAPEIFLKFYDSNNLCSNCYIGGPDRLNTQKKQLFAVRSEELKEVKWPYKIKKTIDYPNKNKAYYLIDNEIF